ncbi:MAG: DUF4943 family protein, partial [Planctomycetota bacterium]
LSDVKEAAKADKVKLGAREAIESFVAAAVAGDFEKAKEFKHPDKLPTDHINDIHEQAKGQNLWIMAVVADDWSALAVSSVIQGDHSRVGPLVSYLDRVVVDGRDNWWVHDIDMVTPDRAERDLKRFLEKYPQAKRVVERGRRVRDLFRSYVAGETIGEEDKAGSEEAPQFGWSGIPILLELAESDKVLEGKYWKDGREYLRSLPMSSISSYLQEEVREGMVALWLIEGLRRGQGRPGGHYRLPLNPICLKKGMSREECEKSAEIHQDVLNAYRRWWQQVSLLAAEEAALLDPLEDTDVEWVGGPWKKADAKLPRWLGPGGSEFDAKIRPGPEGAREVVEAYLSALKAGEYAEAAVFALPGSAVGRQTPGFEQFREQNEVQRMAIAVVCGDDQEVLAVSTEMKGYDGEIGPLVFHLVNENGKWLIDDIDMETSESAEAEVERFLENRAEAKTDETGWGEVTDGLQFGLRCTSGKRAYRVGESVGFVFSVRNVGSQKIELEYVKPHLKDWAPNVRGISGSVCAALPPVQVLPSMSGAYGMRGGEVQLRTLRPGEEWTLDEAAFTIRPIGWEGKIEQTTVFAPAGKYKVNHTLVFPPSYGGRGEELWHGQLASNETELEILPAGATAAAQSDASEEDIETVLRLLGDYVSQRLRAASAGSGDTDAWRRNRSAWEARCNALSAGEIEYLGHLASEHPEAGYRAAACQALGETKNAQAAELLVEPLRDEAPYVRHRAARALGSLRSEKHIPELLRVLKSDTDSGVRAGAAFTLGNIGSKRATKGLVEALEFDEEGQVPEAVLFALMHIMDASALPALRAELKQETNAERRRSLQNVIHKIEKPAWGEAFTTEDIEAMVRSVLYETYDIGTAGWSPMTGALFVERFLEFMQKRLPGQKLFAIAANGTDAQKEALLESVKRMCNIYLNELPEFQLDPNVPWQATVVHSPGVMVYPPLLLQLEDDPARTLDIVTRMYLRMQDAGAKYRRARGVREYIGWGTSDGGTIMAYICHSCMSRLGSDDKFRQRATAEQLGALREYEDHRKTTPKLGPADDEINVMKFAARICSKQPPSRANSDKEAGGLQLRPKELPAIIKSGRTQQVRRQLQRVVDLSQWGPEMPFADALEQLKNSVEPPLNMVVLWRDLQENAAIDRTTPINMEGVSGVYLGTALRLLLRSVSASGAEIDFVIKDGIIVIATIEALPNTLETRVYDIYGKFLRPQWMWRDGTV